MRVICMEKKNILYQSRRDECRTHVAATKTDGLQCKWLLCQSVLRYVVRARLLISMIVSRLIRVRLEKP